MKYQLVSFEIYVPASVSYTSSTSVCHTLQRHWSLWRINETRGSITRHFGLEYSNLKYFNVIPRTLLYELINSCTLGYYSVSCGLASNDSLNFQTHPVTWRSRRVFNCKNPLSAGSCEGANSLLIRRDAPRDRSRCGKVTTNRREKKGAETRNIYTYRPVLSVMRTRAQPRAGRRLK